MKNKKLFFKFFALLSTLFLLFVLANKSNMIFGFISVLVCVAFSFFLNTSESFGIILFLLPNIRILDCCGQTYLVNILIVFLVLKSFLTAIIKNENLSFFAPSLFAALLFFFIEIFHFILPGGNLSTSLFSSLNISFNFFAFTFFIYRLDFEKYFELFSRLLLLGVVCSSITYVVANASSVQSFLYSWNRFSAYGNDPNYLSMYIILGTSGLLINSFRSFSLANAILILFSLLFGLLTTSKMYIICLALMAFVYFILLLKNQKFKTVLAVFGFFSVALLIFRYSDANAFNNLISRFFKRFSSANNVNDLTTGRAELLAEYLNTFTSDPISFIFGRGINYYGFYSNIATVELVAHNTYLDLLLSWGMLGSFFFIIFLIIILGKRKRNKDISLASFLPLSLFLIILFALSCLSSDMFLYLFVFVLAPLKSNERKQQKDLLRGIAFAN